MLVGQTLFDGPSVIGVSARDERQAGRLDGCGCHLGGLGRGLVRGENGLGDARPCLASGVEPPGGGPDIPSQFCLAVAGLISSVATASSTARMAARTRSRTRIVGISR